ncbi:hypothetical protein NPIL_531671 [Nephila pilipes]|uniref:Uncharacterized protein n=1 Tax=Nephila pilipes TaxID=299642 RepID=A0A8X6P6A2_NEPPI|nr:hypothetical protein NPIL_531671 [Nephila pilipes]
MFFFRNSSSFWFGGTPTKQGRTVHHQIQEATNLENSIEELENLQPILKLLPALVHICSITNMFFICLSEIFLDILKTLRSGKIDSGVDH